jgi:hypothetical protein
MQPSRIAVLVAAVFLFALYSSAGGDAQIPTCEIHSGMTVWFIDYAESDYTSSHPLGVLRGIVDINERAWQAKCGADGANAKVFVPFNFEKNGQHESDTRWPQDLYRSKAEALRAYNRLR